MAHPAHYREAHPFVFLVTHWVHTVCILLLTISGLYIAFPFIGGLGFMGLARGVHFLCMYVVLINLFARIALAFFVKSATYPGTREVYELDIKNWLPQKLNRHQLIPWVKYYLFLKKDYPIGAKYGVLQKIAYIFIVPLTLVSAYTGFAIYAPVMNWSIFLVATDAVGGQMHMRLIHYYIMWVFILFTAIHVYLANIKGFTPTWLIFGWKEHGGLEFDRDGKLIGESKH